MATQRNPVSKNPERERGVGGGVRKRQTERSHVDIFGGLVCLNSTENNLGKGVHPLLHLGRPLGSGLSVKENSRANLVQS